MKYAVKTYGVGPEAKSTILTIMAQWRIAEIDFTQSEKKRAVNLKTILPGKGVITGAMVIEIAPVDDFQHAVLDVSNSFKDTIVVCRTWQDQILAIAVNGRIWHRDLVEFMEIK
jgi:hypothetical protein